jgi:hypothetical protein
MRFEVLTAIKTLILILWVVTPFVFSPEDEDGIFLLNIGIYVHNARQTSTSTELSLSAARPLLL